MTNVLAIHNLANGKYLGENIQVKKVAFQMIAAFPVFDLPLTLSINPMTKQFILMGIPACYRAHLKFPSGTLIL